MKYKGYQIEVAPTGYKVYSSYEAWRDNEEPLHQTGSMEEAKNWIDSQASWSPRSQPGEGGVVKKTITKLKYLFRKRKDPNVPGDYDYYYGYEENGRFYRPERRFR